MKDENENGMGKPKEINIHYTEFRAEIYAIIDKALDLAESEYLIRIELEDDIDNLLINLNKRGLK